MTDLPDECPTCDDPVFRWYLPTYDLSIDGEDVGVDVWFHVTDHGLAMHVLDYAEDGVGHCLEPHDGPEVRS